MTISTAAPLPSVDAAELAASFDHCRRVTQQRAGSFAMGLRLTPPPKRDAMYAIYTWMRAADDLADSATQQDSDARRLVAFRHMTDVALDPHAAAPRGPLTIQQAMWPAVKQTLRQYAIARDDLHAMIDGQLLDMTRNRYDRFEQLYDYCYKVASTVGLVCIGVWGYSGGDETRKMAEYRGIGLQLTNILRDLVEDARRGRIYIPIDELARFDYDPGSFIAAVQSRRVDERFDRLMGFQIHRAADFYAKADALDQRISPDCRASSWAIMHVYRRLLDKIAADPRRVLAERVGLGRAAKLAIVGRALWRRGFSPKRVRSADGP